MNFKLTINLTGVPGFRGVAGVIVGVLIQIMPVFFTRPGVSGEGLAFLSGLNSSG